MDGRSLRQLHTRPTGAPEDTMDPDENLEQQLRVAARIRAHVNLSNDSEEPQAHAYCAQCTNDAEFLSDLIESLHDWIRGGGFLPQKWQVSRG